MEIVFLLDAGISCFSLFHFRPGEEAALKLESEGMKKLEKEGMK